MASEYVALGAGPRPVHATQRAGASAGRQFLEPCQICSGRAGRYRHDWLKRCGTCGVLSADLPVAIPELPRDGVIDEDCRLAGLEHLRRSNNARLLEALARQGAAPGQRLLDVGCGAGILLGQAGAAGYEAEGVEPDANVLRLARRNGRVRHGYFPSTLEPDETFDIIVFNDVFEHIPDLAGTLADISRCLRPGGLLCLNCPDKRGLFFRVAAMLDRLGMPRPYDRLWQRDFPSPHVWYFKPAHLAHAARGFGLTHVQDVRLATVKLDGLWQRIRCGGESLLVGAAAFAFTWATYPLAALLPSDATACVFRKDG